MKIHVIFTGGTIGSLISESESGSDIINESYQASEDIIRLYETKYGGDVCFSSSAPYHILSENIKAYNIRLLIQEINKTLKNNDISGIIVTHGTDTLQYTAAVLGYIYGALNIPVVIVSSDYVLTDPRANGLVNFRYAVKFIENGYGNGVYVSYRNQKEPSVIHRAVRLNAHSPFSADITSVCGKYYGRFDNEKYIQCDNSKTEKLALFDNTDNIKLNDISDDIIRITPYVGMKYPAITENTVAVLHESYHSGTICMDEGFDIFAKNAMDRNIPVYLTGVNTKEASYETASRYSEYNIHVLPESAVIAQYCKLWLAVSNEICISEIMQTSVAYDYLY